ncbi:MAG: hypothetical protein IJU99_08780, partial [Lachnospiraceae bacterium]|nr:hypothetical protein [Lachnospiraceae bacterium]
MRTYKCYRVLAVLLAILLTLHPVMSDAAAASGGRDDRKTSLTTEVPSEGGRISPAGTSIMPQTGIPSGRLGESFGDSHEFDSAALVTSELVEGRKENEKHYRLENGAYTAVVYQEPVHVRDSNGSLQEIVNHLSFNELENRYTVTIGDVEKDYAASMSAG